MHPLHDHVAKQLTGKLKARRVVVWYDEPGEFRPFFDEVRGGPRASADPVAVTIGGASARLVVYDGSMFELRAAVEPHVRGDTPDPVVLYLPGCVRDARGSALMELELAGALWKDSLHDVARDVLLRTYTFGVVDELVPLGRQVTYEDVARMAAGHPGSEPPSILKAIFPDARDNDGLIVAWLASDAQDAAIVRKDSTRELTKLISARLGVPLPEGAPLDKLRTVTLRYVLASEFRLDLSCPPPSSLDHLALPSDAAAAVVRTITAGLRASFADAYAAAADRVEQELGLEHARLPAATLGAIDTFRFEERALLRHAGELIAGARYEEAMALVRDREKSFWLDRDVARRSHWEAVRRMAELGAVATEVRANVMKINGDAAAWVAAYTAKDGWYRLDLVQRRLEAWVTRLDDDPEERPLAVARRAYEDACHLMAEGFTRALAKAGWIVASALYQTHVYSDVVASRPRPVAYFLVDAMRFEMGVELSQRLPSTAEVSVRPAVAMLPSITPIGMAALQPGAASSFSVVAQNGKLGAQIEDAFLPDVASRRKLAAARVPKLVDVTLDELLSLQSSKLTKKIDGAQVVVVRSTEIDNAGEQGFNFQARQVMDTVIDNLARAIRKLAAAGIEHAVLTADHGHLFASDRDESMRTDDPRGDTIELHRRCWIGRGGATPPGCIRVAASALGYASDLEFVFPTGGGVLKAGGDLAFHHGGPSLQELIVPVVTVRTKRTDAPKPTPSAIRSIVIPDSVTTRSTSATFELGGQQLMLGASSMVVRPVLMSGGRQVGSAGLAIGAELDRVTGCVTLSPSKPVTLAFVLADDSVASLRIVLQDPTTDAELFKSADIPVRLGM